MPAEQLTLFRLPPAEAAPASRHVVLHGQAIPYALRQGGNRRRLTLTIDERGLRVGAPRGATRGDVEGFIGQHREWVLVKLAEIGATPRHLAVRDGSRLPLLGEPIDIRVQPGHNRSRWIAATLLLEARPQADLNALARRALQRRALDHFGARLAHFAPQLDLAAPSLGLSSARTRWGSCSRQGGIRLNWRLIHLPAHLGDYVAVHELAHLHEMNHGPRFWAWVERACPEWREARAALRAQAGRLPLI